MRLTLVFTPNTCSPCSTLFCTFTDPQTLSTPFAFIREVYASEESRITPLHLIVFKKNEGVRRSCPAVFHHALLSGDRKRVSNHF